VTVQYAGCQNRPMPDEYVTTGAGWFTLSLVNAGLAQSKGRSGLAWWAVSLLLGPIATLVIVAWPPVVEGVEQRRPGTMSSAQSLALIIGVVVLLAVGLLVSLSAGSR
jgi:hypothetical protein